MPHGGARKGAGRKKGAATRKTRKIADNAAQDGLAMPLDVLLHAMRFHFSAERWDEAAEIANKAAPYCHPRLSAVAVVKKDEDEDQEQPVREIVVSTREEAAALLPLLSQAGGIPERA